jgi:putative endonuclease
MPAEAGIQAMLTRNYFVYILASGRNGTLYVGVTNDLARRVYEHKNGVVDGFTKRYGVGLLVWYEVYEDIGEAILREKRIKKWNRRWKLRLIEEANPEWRDLYEEVIR